MKTEKQHIQAILPVLMLAMWLPVSCSLDEEYKPPCPQEEEVEKIFSSHVTRSGGNGTDLSIYTVDVLVFKRSDAAVAGQPDGNAVFVEQRHAWYNQTTDKYVTILRVGEDLDLYFAANARELISNAGLTGGMTFAAVNEELTMTGPERVSLTAANAMSAHGGLPMWGIISDQDIAETTPYDDLGEVKMLRSVASADIFVTAGNFVLEAGHVVYGADRGYLPYSSARVTADANGLLAVSPFVPAAAATTKDWRYPATGLTEGNEIRDVFYLYENDADDASVAAGNKHYTKIILEGRYNGGEVTYYPIAFRNTDHGSPDYGRKLPLLRNHKYLIRITSANGDGYDTLENAKEGEEMNVDYDVIDWNENADIDIFVSGTKYISVPSRSVTLHRREGSQREMTITTNFVPGDFVLEMENDPDVTDNQIRNSRFAVETTHSNSGEGIYAVTFTFTALADYGTTQNPSVLTVTAGERITFTITITQVNETLEDWNDGGNQNTTLEN